MSSRVRKYLPVLKRIAKLGDKAKRDYARKCDKNFYTVCVLKTY